MQAEQTVEPVTVTVETPPADPLPGIIVLGTVLFVLGFWISRLLASSNQEEQEENSR